MTIEKRLMQTMDKILIKKKRIVQIKKSLPNQNSQKRGIWDVLTSVGTGKGNQESKFFIQISSRNFQMNRRASIKRRRLVQFRARHLISTRDFPAPLVSFLMMRHHVSTGLPTL